MNNLTVTKVGSTERLTCMVKDCPTELCRMLIAVLGDILRFTDEEESDILITGESGIFLFTDTRSGDSAIVDRPAVPDTLRDTVISILSRRDLLSFTADPDSCSAVLGDTSVQLTKTEFRLYSAILENGKKLISAEELSKAVWGETNRNLCTVYLSYLRTKLDRAFGDGTLISVRGKGYRLRSF